MDKFTKKFQSVNMKKVIISIFLVIALVVQFSFLSYLFKAITPDNSKEQEDQNVIMKYSSSGDIDYRVYLKKNDFINKEYIGSGEAYILNLIDHIQLFPTYNFKSSEKTKVNGNSRLVAKLKVYYRESSDKSSNPEVLKKEITLDEKTFNFNDSKYSMNGSYDISLDSYLSILNNFQKEVKIAMEGYIEVSYETNFNGTIGGASYNDKYESTLKIPLSTSVIKLDKSNSNEKTSKVREGDLVKTNKTVLSYIVFVNIIVFMVVCVLLKKLFMFTNKTEYQRLMNKLLRNYDDIIVNTSTMIDTSNYTIMEITEFKELLNLSRELLLPIMNYEVMKDKITWFYVIRENILYRYIVSASKLEEEKQSKEEKSVKNKISNNDNFKNKVKDIGSKVVEFLKKLFINIKNLFVKIFKKVSDFIKNIISKIKKNK